MGQRREVLSWEDQMRVKNREGKKSRVSRVE